MFLFIFILIVVFITPVFSQAPCGNTPIYPNLSNNKTKNKIVGGNLATPYSWPWQIVYCEIMGDSCGMEGSGTIIGKRWILGAAHYIYANTLRPQDFLIKTGVYNETDINESSEVIYRVVEMFVHPMFDPNADYPDYDIALIKVDNDIIFDDHVQIMCLPSEDVAVIQEPNSAWVTGWGLTSDGGSSSFELKQVSVPFVNYAACEKAYGNQVDQQRQVCAGAVNRSVCGGDSGGPLQQQNKDGYWFQYGIVSYGHGCAKAGYPAVYTRVSAYCDFIMLVTNGDVECMDPNNMCYDTSTDCGQYLSVCNNPNYHETLCKKCRRTCNLCNECNS